MSWAGVGWMMLGAVFLICFGLLLGATWTTQAIQPKLRQLAEERRQLNAEWLAVRAARQRLSVCPRCGYRFTEHYLAPTGMESTPDDD